MKKGLIEAHAWVPKREYLELKAKLALREETFAEWLRKRISIEIVKNSNAKV